VLRPSWDILPARLAVVNGPRTARARVQKASDSGPVRSPGWAKKGCSVDSRYWSYRDRRHGGGAQAAGAPASRPGDRS
jgi:hypothetical protein